MTIKPDLKKLPECIDHGHQSVNAILEDAIIAQFRVPYLCPKQTWDDGRGNQFQIQPVIKACIRCGMVYWEPAT